MPIYFHTVYGYFPIPMAELHSCDRDCMACQLWNSYCLALYKKMLLSPWTRIVIENDFWENEMENVNIYLSTYLVSMWTSEIFIKLKNIDM